MPIKDRGKYVGLVVITILPFCPSVLWAQLIAQQSNWRYNGILVCVWNFIGLVLCVFCYKDPSRLTEEYTARHVLRQVDYIGGILSTCGITLFMMGLQWGASQVSIPSEAGHIAVLTLYSMNGAAHITSSLSFSGSYSSLPSSYGRCMLHTPWFPGQSSTKRSRP